VSRNQHLHGNGTLFRPVFEAEAEALHAPENLFDFCRGRLGCFQTPEQPRKVSRFFGLPTVLPG